MTVLSASALVLLVGASGAPEPPGSCAEAAVVHRFADWLFTNGDYYRAIGEYERLLFLHPGGPDAQAATLQIGRAYARGGQIEKAEEVLGRVEQEATEPSIRDEATFEIGYARLKGGEYESAVAALGRYVRLDDPAGGPGKPRALLLQGLALLRAGGRDEAAVAAFGDAARANVQLSSTARDLEIAVAALQKAPSKSPVLAGMLSAVVPGLGHVYLGEPWIGLGALVWNGVFAYATYDAFHGGHPGLGVLLAALESVWYGGAIFGGVSGAMRYNRDVRQERLDALEGRYRWLIDGGPIPGGLSLRVGGSL